MGNRENKRQGIRIVLGVIFTLGLFGTNDLLAVVGSEKLMAYNAPSSGPPIAHLCSSVTLPSGVFYFLLFGTAMALLLIGRCLHKKFLGKDQVWRQYRLDTFFWAEWQWDYSWNGKITNLWCECEKCAERMKPKVVPDGNDGLGVRFLCNRCGKQSTTIRSTENEKDALDRVEKKIMRKIRVGKYRGAIEGRMLDGDEEQCF